ncbi:MAG: hypothetical protein E7010_04790 [Alphaproteobacteria bacterium]|nr:hypothetical protein [Alphaproteobacteria bacterium]
MSNKNFNISALFLISFICCLRSSDVASAQTPILIHDILQTAKSQAIIVESNQSVSQKTSVALPNQFQKPSLTSISFTWNHPVNLAAFERNGNIWLVFDKPETLDVEALKKSAGELAKDIFVFMHPLATLVEIIPAEGVKYSVRKEGLLWVVDLFTREPPQTDFKDMTIFTQYDSLKQPYLYIPSNIAGNTISIIDPEIGDVISVAPVSQPHIGISTPYSYPEFDILSTAQGLAFVIKSPDIILSRGNAGLTLRAKGHGLNITSDLDSLKRRQRQKDSSEISGAFNLQIQQRLIEMKFNEVLDYYKREILNAPPSQKNKLRVDLSRYYIYYGLGTNALYILNQMEKAELPESKTNDFYSLKGIANFLARRYREAAEDFSKGDLPNTDEGVFWRTLAQSTYEQKEENNTIIFAYISLIKDYPQEIKDVIAVKAAENALNSNDDLSAQNFIDILSSVSNRIKDLSPQIGYLSGQKLVLQGYPRNAIKEYRKLISSTNNRFSALARYENAVLSERLNLISLQNTITELERLRYAWNDPTFKLNLLNKLSELYIKDNDYYQAINSLNEARIFAEDNQKEMLLQKMITIFENIYLSHQADAKLSPIKALALYQDFNWLSELSSRQTAIIQRLADRLFAVDLLPRAYNLLQNLLQNHKLTSEEKARIGARLAIIELYNESPSNALKLLDQTNAPDLSAETTAPRRVIRARALSALDESDAALELLKEDYSKNALLFKFQIYWDSQKWAEASDTIKYLVEEPTPGKPLSKEQINYILDWATTLKQAGKETVLVRLRNKFLPYFEKTPHYSAFNILTNHLEKDKIDIKEIRSIVDDVRNFSKISRSYYESLIEPSKPEEN